MITGHVGFILDYTSELFHRDLRRIGHYGGLWERWFEATPGEWSARDKRSINRSFSGLTKLIFPDGEMTQDDAHLLLRLSIELRLRVRHQLNKIDPKEFPLTSFSYREKETGAQHVCTIDV